MQAMRVCRMFQNDPRRKPGFISKDRIIYNIL